MEPKFSFHHLLTGLLGAEGAFYPGGEAGGYKGDAQCKNCSLTYPQFRQIGRLGCSQCYDAFGSYLTPLLKRIHGSSRHNGKLPHRIGDTVRLKKQAAQLREKLQQKIAREEFEEAARIRDEIRMLEKRVSGGE